MNKYFWPVLTCLAVPAQAENHIANFQLRMIDRASQAGAAGHAVACAGLFRALALTSDGNQATADAFAEKEADAAYVGILFYQSESEADDATVVSYIGDHVAAVSAINLAWFTENLATGNGPLNDQLRENYVSCDEKSAEWLAIINGQ